MASKILFILMGIIFVGSCSCSPELETKPEDCSVENNCAENKQCLNKQCVALECSPNGINEVCGDGNICYNGKCVKLECDEERSRTVCGAGNICLYGKCRKDPYYCSEDAPYGLCEDGKKCYNGVCKSFVQCSVENPAGECIDTWEECINGECKAKKSEKIYPLYEDSQNLKVNQPLEKDRLYLSKFLIPRDGYRQYSDKRMFGMYDFDKKKLTHIFTYEESKNGVSGRLIQNHKTGKWYYFYWWNDDGQDVELVELDPEIGKLKKKKGLDDISFDSQMWYISPDGKALIESSSFCKLENNKPGRLLIIYDIEKDTEKRWCVEGEYIQLFYLENGEIYMRIWIGNATEQYEYSTVIIKRLDIENFKNYEIYNGINFASIENIGFSEDGLIFYTELDVETQKKIPAVVDMFTSEKYSLNFDFSKLLTSDKDEFYLSPYFSNGKYLFYVLWVIERKENDTTFTKKRIVIAVDVQSKEYKVVHSNDVNSFYVSNALSYHVSYIKKLNIIKNPGTFLDLNSNETYWMTYVGEP